ncbi:MAG TPA: hypothetical protein VLD67_21825 [Vicinamibacterales bacterium]|nr:hypothetical protein [Vicinamibacterales bacterium]
MRLHLKSAVLLMILPVSGASGSQIDESGGTLRATLTDALTEMAKGNCSDKLIGPMILDACEKQISKLKPALQQLGEVKNVRYRGIEQLPSGVGAEVYRVVFAKGEMTWMVAAGPNGKLTVFYSAG